MELEESRAELIKIKEEMLEVPGKIEKELISCQEAIEGPLEKFKKKLYRNFVGQRNLYFPVYKDILSYKKIMNELFKQLSNEVKKLGKMETVIFGEELFELEGDSRSTVLLEKEQ